MTKIKKILRFPKRVHTTISNYTKSIKDSRIHKRIDPSIFEQDIGSYRFISITDNKELLNYLNPIFVIHNTITDKVYILESTTHFAEVYGSRVFRNGKLSGIREVSYVKGAISIYDLECELEFDNYFEYIKSKRFILDPDTLKIHSSVGSTKCQYGIDILGFKTAIFNNLICAGRFFKTPKVHEYVYILDPNNKQESVIYSTFINVKQETLWMYYDEYLKIWKKHCTGIYNV